MDFFQEKRNIKKQNESWSKNNKKNKNNLQKGHPWLSLNKQVMEKHIKNWEDIKDNV
jgi:hypothetical protein